MCLSFLKRNIIYHLEEGIILILRLLMLWNLELESHPYMYNKENPTRGLPTPPFSCWLHLLSPFSNWVGFQAGTNILVPRLVEESSNKISHHMTSWVKNVLYQCQWVAPSQVTMRRPDCFSQKKWDNSFIFAHAFLKVHIFKNFRIYKYILSKDKVKTLLTSQTLEL